MLEPGTLFASDYRVRHLLAEGGMGAVYVVDQLSTGRPRALKVMRAAIAQDRRLRERFTQEARVGSRVESEHVVEVLAAGVDPERGMPWLVMELLDGVDLSALCERLGPLALFELRPLLEQLCHALDAAHRVGVVHRDLKPENLFLARSRRAGVPYTLKVLDFGIAKVLLEASTSHTQQTLGSPLWMAPEQLLGEPVGPPADVWALGLLAFWGLTHRHFWRAANEREPVLSALLAERLAPPFAPASVRAAELRVGMLLPQGFDSWFERCVARDPAARFPNAGVAWQHLLPYLTGAPNDAAGRLAGLLGVPVEPSSPGSAPQPASAGVASAHAPTQAGAPVLRASQLELAATVAGTAAAPAPSPRRSLPWALVPPLAVVLLVASALLLRARVQPNAPSPPPPLAEVQRVALAPQPPPPPPPEAPAPPPAAELAVPAPAPPQPPAPLPATVSGPSVEPTRPFALGSVQCHFQRAAGSDRRCSSAGFGRAFRGSHTDQQDLLHGGEEAAPRCLAAAARTWASGCRPQRSDGLLCCH